MATQFTPCPACGAVGEVGNNCQFCGTTIILKEEAKIYDSRIINHRTITPQQYAEKVSIYHNLESLYDGVVKVSIGDLEGIVNLNGDLIYPLGNESITKGFQNNVVRIGDKFLNLENFEYVEDPYYNQALLEKITILSNDITNNAPSDATIYAGFDKNGESLGLCVQDASNIEYEDYETYDFSPQLMLTIGFAGSDKSEQIKLYKRFTSCVDFELFAPLYETDYNGIPVPALDREYYILFGHDAESCCKVLLRILHQMYDINPENITSDTISCFGDVFNNSSNGNSSNSGCAGMLALMLGIGGASVYGIVELISRLIA